MPIIVKNFWTDPSNLPVEAKELTFGYEDQKGKEFEYKVQVKNNDLKSFHAFVFSIMASKKKNFLPWPAVKDLKNFVIITNLKDPTVQMELPLKVAREFLRINNIITQS